MPATKTQLIGGLFQDADGTVLNAGYLIFELSQDEQVTGLNTEVCAGVRIKINLNSSGSIDTSTPQYLWGNDDLLPINSFYIVSGYTATGQLAWGPNYQQVTSGTTFDVGIWIPNLMTNWTPPLTNPLLETNGSINSTQSLLNLKNGSRIAITDDGVGGITIASTLAPLALKVDGTPNVSQTSLDLEAGNGMTLTDEGDGGVQIDGVALKTNGSANGSQKILNLKNGTSVTITDDGVGGITINSSAAVVPPALPRPDNKYFALYMPYGSNGSQINTSAVGDAGLSIGSGAGITGTTPSTVLPDATHGPYWHLPGTGTGSAGFQEIEGTQARAWSGRAITFVSRMSVPTVAITNNFFIGLTDNAAINSASSAMPLHNIVGFLLNTSVNTHWRTITGNAATQNIGITTVTGDGTPRLFKIDYTPGVSAVFSIDGVVVSTLNSVPDLPSATVSMMAIAMINPYGLVAVAMDVEGLYWEQASS